MKFLLPLFALVLFAAPALADTVQLSTHVYKVDAGVVFEIENVGASDYLFTWADDTGTYSQIADPSFVLSTGQTYTFRRISSAHPLVITDETLPTDGTDGSYFRTSTDGGVIDAATLTPLADFTADPAPTSDQIVWTPTGSELGTYFYTCRVTFHTGMTGGIRVVQDSPVSTRSDAWSSIKSLY